MIIIEKDSPINKIIERFSKGKKKMQKVKEDLTPEVNQDTLLRYYRKRGVVGEESTALLQTLCAINGISFGIYASSGTGKSHLVEQLISLFPNDVYTLDLGSKKAAVYEADKINKAKILYLPELQKSLHNPFVKEIVKGMAEGRDVSIIIRNQAKRKNENYVLKGKTVIFTLAKESTFNYDTELGRRFLLLEMDDSSQLTKNILREKSRLGKKDNELSYMEERALRKHVNYCINSNFNFENPFMEYVAEQLPETVLARSYVNYLIKLFDASTKFNHQRRYREESTLFTSIDDIVTINDTYWDSLIKTLGENPCNYILDMEECYMRGVNAMEETYPEKVDKWLI